MNRLTGRMENNDPYYPHCYESNCDSNCATCDFDYEVLEKLTAYEDLEEKLEKVYGECDGLLEVVVNGLVKHKGVEIGKPKKARLLTDEDVDKWEDLKNAEEQGLLLIEPCDVEDIIDKLFSHNERVSLWVSVKEEITYHQLIWSGMAWDIPEVFKSCYFVKIFGTIPEKITQADIINIEVVLTKEAEAALTRMEKSHE